MTRLEALRAELARWDAALEPAPDNVTPIRPEPKEPPR